MHRRAIRVAGFDPVKVVILAGGRGSRLGRHTSTKPKPMVEIGGKPMLWHIMSFYRSSGFDDFIIAAGYRGEMIRDHFRSSAELSSGDSPTSSYIEERDNTEWRVCVVDTGLETMTGGRILRLRSHVGNQPFMATYGDGLSDVDLHALLEFHRKHGKIATVTAVHPTARFGALSLTGDAVTRFSEKPQTDTGWINGGFFVFEPRIFDYLNGDESILEREPLERLANENQLMAFRHHGFWQPMDTPREREMLEALWNAREAPWKTWS